MVDVVEGDKGDGPPGGGSAQVDAQKAAMDAAKGEGQVAQRPDHVPEKFWDAEKGEVNTAALLGSYAELEKGATGSASDGGDAGDANTGDSTATQTNDAGPTFSMKKYEEEFVANEGQISEASYKELQDKYNMPKSEVDRYIEFREFEARQAEQEVYDLAGGEDTYNALLKWAGVNKTVAEVNEINAALQNTDTVEPAKLAVMKLKQEYAESVGIDPNLLGGNVAPSQTGGVQPFNSQAEAVRARQDKRYENDPAYRELYMARMRVSTALLGLKGGV